VWRGVWIRPCLGSIYSLTSVGALGAYAEHDKDEKSTTTTAPMGRDRPKPVSSHFRAYDPCSLS